MIPRYTPADIGAVWSEANRVKSWLKIELEACRAMAELSLIPMNDFQVIERAAATVDADKLALRSLEIEETTKHDVIAFLTAFEEVAGPAARHVHFGLTSSDVLDSSLALRLVEATALIEAELLALRVVVAARATEHKTSAMIGRSHGIHAEPITFGLVLAGFYAELTRDLARLRVAREEIRVGKLSGAVGTNAHLPPEVESRAMLRLGLVVETVSTQVIPRDRHAQYFATLATIAASLERMSIEIRHLQRTEVREAEEPFTKGQKGSSAMPHKRNPILSENLTGLARLMRSWAGAAFEDVALWHERDISHSAVERVIAPDATITMLFMLRRMKKLIEGLVVYPDRMRQNLAATRGLCHSQTVLLALTKKGVARQEAYVLVQRNAMRVFDENNDLLPALQSDPDVTKVLTMEEIEACFDLAPHLANAAAIIDRALASG